MKFFQSYKLQCERFCRYHCIFSLAICHVDEKGHPVVIHDPSSAEAVKFIQSSV